MIWGGCKIYSNQVKGQYPIAHTNLGTHLGGITNTRNTPRDHQGEMKFGVMLPRVGLLSLSQAVKFPPFPTVYKSHYSISSCLGLQTWNMSGVVLNFYSFILRGTKEECYICSKCCQMNEQKNYSKFSENLNIQPLKKRQHFIDLPVPEPCVTSHTSKLKAKSLSTREFCIWNTCKYIHSHNSEKAAGNKSYKLTSTVVLLQLLTVNVNVVYIDFICSLWVSVQSSSWSFSREE